MQKNRSLQTGFFLPDDRAFIKLDAGRRHEGRTGRHQSA
jgi:hypothetical protein